MIMRNKDKVRVLVVDDSALMRQLISKALVETDEIEVVGTAVDPLDAREKIKKLNPDVLTLDVEMPNMDGISFLEKIMRLRPMPVVMISTLTAAGAEATLRALELGAVDFHQKPTRADMFSAEAAEIRAKVLTAARVRSAVTRDTAKKENDRIKPGAGYVPSSRLVTIGSSTGGVEALHVLLSRFPENCPPTFITQHMPEHFTGAFAKRLDQKIGPKVIEATDNAFVDAGTVAIAPGGGQHLKVVRGGARWQCRLVASPPISGHRPSVDCLFESVADVAGRQAIAVILTGMGSDGAKGMKMIRDRGGRTIGQSKDSCVVYGMPKVAYELGGVEEELPLERIADAIFRICQSPV